MLQLFRFLLCFLRYQTPSYSLKSGLLTGLRICMNLLMKTGPGFLDFGKLKEREREREQWEVKARKSGRKLYSLNVYIFNRRLTSHDSLFIFYFFYLLGYLIESITILASPSMIIDLR